VSASDAARVVAELRHALQALAQAGLGMQAAAQKAARAEDQLAALGLRRVAEGLHGVRRRLGQGVPVIEAATSCLRGAAAAAERVTEQTSPADASGLLRMSVAHVDTAERHIRAVLHELPKAEAEVAQFLRGAQPGPLLEILAQIRKDVGAAGAHGLEAKKYAEATIVRAAQLGTGGGAAASSGGAGPPVAPAASSGSESNKSADAREARRSWLRRMREGLAWHRRQQAAMWEAGGVSELYVEKPGEATGYHRVDHYNERRGQITSMKHTQLAEISLETARAYLREAKAKYSPGTAIASVPSTPERLQGKELEGRVYLRVPVQRQPVPPNILAIAEEFDVMIIDENGRIQR
jgi:hypothetical protein